MHLLHAGGEWAHFNPMWPRKQRFDMYGPNLLHTPRPDLLNVMLMELRNPYFTLPVSHVHPEAQANFAHNKHQLNSTACASHVSLLMDMCFATNL